MLLDYIIFYLLIIQKKGFLIYEKIELFKLEAFLFNIFDIIANAAVKEFYIW
jgi:hypothetical protein